MNEDLVRLEEAVQLLETIDRMAFIIDITEDERNQRDDLLKRLMDQSDYLYSSIDRPFGPILAPPPEIPPIREERPVADSSATVTLDIGHAVLSDGRTGEITYDVTIGSTFIVPVAPDRPGYAFLSWQGQENRYYPGDEIKVTKKHDQLIAIWKKIIG